MPLATDPQRPDWTLLLDADGHAVARFLGLEREGRHLADLLEPVGGATTEAIAPVALDELRGWRVAGDAALGRRLVAAGGVPRRHAHVLSRDLRRARVPAEWAAPALPAGVRLGAVDRGAGALLDAYAAAYPPEHPDWRAEGRPADLGADLGHVLDGQGLGPLLEASRLALDADGRAIGAVLVTAADGEPPLGGPWLAQLFRDPDPAYAGTGRGLLQAALARLAAAELPALSLAVTDGNPAMRLYEALGFELALSSFSVDL